MLKSNLNYVYDHAEETKNMTDTEGATYLLNNWNYSFNSNQPLLRDPAVLVRVFRNTYRARCQILSGKKEIYTALLEREV